VERDRILVTNTIFNDAFPKVVAGLIDNEGLLENRDIVWDLAVEFRTAQGFLTEAIFTTDSAHEKKIFRFPRPDSQDSLFLWTALTASAQKKTLALEDRN